LTNETLEEVMDIIEIETTSSRKANRHWNIPFTSLFDHMNGKTQSRKYGLTNVLIKEKDHVIVTWILVVKKIGLSITF
jgi:hypothetical protein